MAQEVRDFKSTEKCYKLKEINHPCKDSLELKTMLLIKVITVEV